MNNFRDVFFFVAIFGTLYPSSLNSTPKNCLSFIAMRSRSKVKETRMAKKALPRLKIKKVGLKTKTKKRRLKSRKR